MSSDEAIQWLVVATAIAIIAVFVCMHARRRRVVLVVVPIAQVV